MMREGLEETLSRQSGLRVVGAFGSAGEVLAQASAEDQILVYDLGTARQEGTARVIRVARTPPANKDADGQRGRRRPSDHRVRAGGGVGVHPPGRLAGGAHGGDPLGRAGDAIPLSAGDHVALQLCCQPAGGGGIGCRPRR